MFFSWACKTELTKLNMQSDGHCTNNPYFHSLEDNCSLGTSNPLQTLVLSLWPFDAFCVSLWDSEDINLCFPKTL